jgi:hypothetical protein
MYVYMLAGGTLQHTFSTVLHLICPFFQSLTEIVHPDVGGVAVRREGEHVGHDARRELNDGFTKSFMTSI